MLVDFGQISLYHGRNENYCFKVSAAFLDYSVRGKRLVELQYYLQRLECCKVAELKA